MVQLIESILQPQSDIRVHSCLAADAVLPILGHSPSLVRVLAQIQQYSAYSAPVLIRGETGTGKELVARAIHDAGPRAKRPYLVCNCSAFSDELVSTEFFGHAKGAFT